MSTVTVSPRLKRSGAIATVAGLALLAVPAMSLLSTAAAVDPVLPTECSQPVSPVGADVVCTYTAAAEHSFVVPTGVTTLTVDLIGGKGGDGTATPTPGTGGQGAEVKGDITVTAGATIFAEVGGDGIAGGKGGFNGGGNTGATTATGTTLGGGGGGASDIRTNSSDLTTRLVVAGGGGGAGAAVNGGGAEADGVGAAGVADTKTNGKGATALAAGAAGTPTNGPVPGTAATSGALLGGSGGEGRTNLAVTGYTGGGGGGGWFGGGGGDGDGNVPTTGAGGGGGSSKVPAANPTGPTLTASAAMVKITYTPGTATVLKFAMTSPIGVGVPDPITDIHGLDSSGATVALAATFALDPATAGTCDSTPGSESCLFNTIGDVKVTGTAGALTADLTVTVIHGPAATLTIAPVNHTTNPNVAVTYTTEGIDAGTPPNTFDATSESTFVIAPTSGGSTTNASCTLNVCTAEALGTYSVTATDGNATAVATLEVVAAPTTSPTPTPTPTPSGSTTPPGGTNNNGGKGPLANTGAAVENGVRYALALLALGAAVVAFARRRQLRIAHPFVQRPRANPSIGFRLPPHTH